MGIGRAAVALLLEEAVARPFSGKLATLGRQTIRATPKEIGNIPQQALYTARWNAPNPSSEARHDRLKRVLRRVPGAFALATAVWARIIPRGRRGLKFMGDY